ncbi:MAG: hypothetical protein PWQ67_1256 [Clostridia bacterium]|jgi:hypothetical protein|nr:hypothetical protein [Clostridia bacterium]
MKLRKKASFWFFKTPKLAFPNFKRPNFNLKWILVITLVLVLVGGGIGVYRNYNTVPPQEAVNTALTNTLNAESYRYQAISKKIVDDNEELLSEVIGEKSNGNVHFTGKLHVVNSDFEIYRIGDKLYRKDVFSKDWLIVEDVNVKATEKLIQEINPLGTFTFTVPIDVEYVGKEMVNDKKCKKYEVMAQTENKYLEVLWKDFTYTIWIDKSGFLTKAEIYAVNKQHENQRLIMSVEFSDYNKEIVINPPV